MHSGVYRTVSGKCYVGQAQHIAKRWHNHRATLRYGNHKSRKLQNSYNKHGDAGWREFRRQIEYKSPIYGGTVGIIDMWFPSSKTCRKCGQIRDDLTLSDRTFNCDGCGHTEDRDLNAAHNICTAGLAGIDAHGPEGSGSIAAKPCRVEVRTIPCPLVGTL